MSQWEIIVPFNPGPGNGTPRQRNYRVVRDYHDEQGWTSYPAMSSGPYTPARMRNHGAELSRGAPLVFNDADSIVPPQQMLEMVRLAQEAPGLVFGFTVYSRLADVPIAHWSDALTAPVEWQMFNSMSSGCVAISRWCFEQVGGYDETWEHGFEDYDFAQRCANRWPLRRVDGELYHLWHPRPLVEPENGPDAERYAALYG